MFNIWREYKLRNEIRQIMAVFERQFDPEDNLIWERWIEFCGNNFEKVFLYLFGTDVSDKFKARALLVLLIPHFEFMPSWYEFPKYDFHLEKNFLILWRLLGYKRGLSLGSQPLKKMAVELIDLFTSWVRKYPKMLKNSSELTVSYNEAIKRLLAGMEPVEPEAERLFNMFDLYCTAEKDQVSVSVILSDFLMDPIIPDYWKMRMEENFRKSIPKPIISADGIRKQSLEEYSYVNSFMLQIDRIDMYSDILPYKPELFMTQLDEVIRLGFPKIEIRKIMNILSMVKIYAKDEFLRVTYSLIPAIRDIYSKSDLAVAENFYNDMILSVSISGGYAQMLKKKIRKGRKFLNRYTSETQVAERERDKIEREKQKEKILLKMK